MDLEYKDFIKALESEETDKGVTVIAENYGCRPQYIYQILNGSKTAGRRAQIKIAKACGYKTVTEFVSHGDFPTDNPEKQKIPPVSFQNLFEKKHFEEIKKFKNKEAGLEVNEFLVRLESLSVKEFHKVIGEIKGLVYELEDSKQKQQQRPGPETGMPDPKSTGTG